MRALIAWSTAAICLLSYSAFGAQSAALSSSIKEQHQILLQAVNDKAVYIDRIADSGVFHGYIKTDTDTQYPIELYLLGPVSICYKQSAQREFRVCLSYTMLDAIEGDEDHTDPVNISYRDILHVYISGKTEVVSRTIHYFRYEDIIDFKTSGSFNDEQTKLAQRVIKNSYNKAKEALGSHGNIKHPEVPKDLINITLVEEVGPYRFTALLKSKDFAAKLATVYAQRIDNRNTFQVTFIDEEATPELLDHSYRYKPKFYSATFSGKPIYEICRFDGNDKIQSCGEYWVDLNQYFQDEAERDLFNYM